MPHVLLRELAGELSGLKSEIKRLQSGDKHFARLVETYRTLDREIHDGEEHPLNVSDETFETMKKRRLLTKDMLYALFNH